MRLVRSVMAFAVTSLCGVASAQETATPDRVKTQDSVTVTADRGLANVSDSAASVAVVSAEQIQGTPGLALDDALRTVAGFQLFRRTSSWTANPTSDGVSLRGLGSTAASRTLVVSDEVPLNDPFGGWVHWNEVPSPAIERVELERGGAADLYGSSAIGGVILVDPVSASPKLTASVSASGAGEDSAKTDVFVRQGVMRVPALFALSTLTTAGYITTAPAERGTVDVPSNMTSESARLEFDGEPKGSLRLFARGNVLDEARSNGTLLQTNGTRLWRYTGGADLRGAKTTGSLRLFGAREAYRQSFSSIASNRNSETLTKLQRVPTDELGLATHGSRVMPQHVTAAFGMDVRDIRATDDETTVASSVVTSTTARQRATGGYADAIWQPGAWSVSGSVRVDSFRTFDARQVVSNSATVKLQPELDELMVSPRAGVVWRPLMRKSQPLALTASAFRAFRGPTMNELYRTGQVGSQTTLANNALLAERATGFEFGPEITVHPLRVRATYFWTEVNRPISAVTIAQTTTSQTLLRENLGQIRSRGVMFEAQTATRAGFDASVSWQYAVATVTAFSVAPAYVGNWIPQVPRESVTARLNYERARVIALHLDGIYSGQQFDDAANENVLHPFARFDAEAEHTFSRGLTMFVAAQNALNRAIDAGRTPVLTLAAPRLVEGGLRWRFTR